MPQQYNIQYKFKIKINLFKLQKPSIFCFAVFHILLWGVIINN